ncbi:alpha/beta family hydrolase [Desulfopila sp. IMCC35008]|uniref:alpha/beta family hydrolase n=1 Tax=Desulfopila sp. IMCC35008 TaxID=2653858 RepID=UPI0013D6572C|nr:alpha/beta family hydrolase [Desulfopila sp. IMCC35008]
MKTLLLPGINPETIEWISELAEKLELDKSKNHIHRYTFWSNNTIDPDLSNEASYLPREKYDLVIGKSFGSLVAMQAHLEKRIHCDRAILLGIPIKSFKKRSIAQDALSLLQNDKTFVIQQNNDKFGTVDEFGENKPVNLLTIEGEDHLYIDYELYIDQVGRWLHRVS